MEPVYNILDFSTLQLLSWIGFTSSVRPFSAEKRTRIGTQGHKNYIFRMLFTSNCLSSAWGSFPALAKISDVKIFADLLLP